MTCDVTTSTPEQTLTERKAEVREAVDKLNKGLIDGSIKAVVGKTGGIAFTGWDPLSRSGVSDGCGYRLLMVMGSTMAKLTIAKAEQLAGRQVDKRAVAHGHHSHDGGHTWHGGHKR